MGVQRDEGYIHKIRIPLGKTVCGVCFGAWIAASTMWQPVNCPDCLKRKGWRLVWKKVQKNMKIKATREELAARWAQKIDERRKLAFEYEPESKERKFIEGMVTGLDLALIEFLMWEEEDGEPNASTG